MTEPAVASDTTRTRLGRHASNLRLGCHDLSCSAKFEVTPGATNDTPAHGGDERELPIVTKGFLSEIARFLYTLSLRNSFHCSKSTNVNDTLHTISVTTFAMSESEKPAGSKFREGKMEDKPSDAPPSSFTEPVDTGRRKKSERAPSSRRLSGDTVVEKRRLSGDTVVESEHAPEQDDQGESGNADSGRGRVLQNKMWFYTFLLHTVAYFGGSGCINYLSISTDKQLLTERGQGPIDLYVLRIQSR